MATTPKAPVGLGPRGRALWKTLHAERVFTAGAQVLAEEACRIADRLERLDGILRGKDAEWLTFREIEEGSGQIAVYVNDVLEQARKQELALKQLVAEIRQSTAGGEQGAEPTDVADELQKKREARLAQSRAQ